jgi:ribose transport system ATP-binding protein
MSEPAQPGTHERREMSDGQPRDVALEGIDVRKSYGGVVALDDATFRAALGEVHALVGENGAGKSTMIKTLAGVIRPDEGVVRIQGEEVRLRSPEHALRRGVATMFQELTLLPRMTVAENLLIGHEPRGRANVIRRREMPSVASELLAEHGVESVDPSELVENLPLAQQQLVEIVRAIMRDPSVLILDEPTSALSRREVEWLFGVVRNLREQGTCVVFTSHRWSEVTDLADRITVFRNGTDVGTHARMSEEEAVRLMTGRQVSTAYVEPEEEPEREVVLERGSWRRRVCTRYRSRCTPGRCLGSVVSRARASASCSTPSTASRRHRAKSRSAASASDFTTRVRRSPPASPSSPRTARPKAFCCRCRSETT